MEETDFLRSGRVTCLRYTFDLFLWEAEKILRFQASSWKCDQIYSQVSTFYVITVCVRLRKDSDYMPSSGQKFLFYGVL